jgi:hypothetical protein
LKLLNEIIAVTALNKINVSLARVVKEIGRLKGRSTPKSLLLFGIAAAPRRRCRTRGKRDGEVTA